MPKWVLLRAEATPIPDLRASEIASAMARVPITNPKPFWPSSAAAAGATRFGKSLGLGLMRPRRRRSRYPGRRVRPCVSTPRRSARTRHAATVAASFFGTPCAASSALAKASASSCSTNTRSLIAARSRAPASRARWILPAGMRGQCQSKRSARPSYELGGELGARREAAHADVLAVPLAGGDRPRIGFAHPLVLVLPGKSHVGEEVVGAHQHHVHAFDRGDLIDPVDRIRGLELYHHHGRLVHRRVRLRGG